MLLYELLHGEPQLGFPGGSAMALPLTSQANARHRSTVAGTRWCVSPGVADTAQSLKCRRKSDSKLGQGVADPRENAAVPEGEFVGAIPENASR